MTRAMRAWTVPVAAVLLAAALVLMVAYEYGWVEPGDPFAPLPDDLSVAASLAGAIPQPGSAPLASPMGIAIAGRRVFVAESGAGRVAVFTVAGKPLRPIVLPVAEGAIRAVPTSIASMGLRTVAVVDAAAGRVLVMRATGDKGRLRFRIGEDDPTAAPARPTAVAYANGTLYVADAATGTILRYDRRGRPKGALGGDSDPPLGYIGGMAVSGGALVVAESDSDRVFRLDLASGERTEVCPGVQALPRGIGAVTGGRVAITEVLSGTVYVCGGESGQTKTIDKATAPDAVLASPEGVAWRGRANRLYVTDPDQGRIVVINVRM